MQVLRNITNVTGAENDSTPKPAATASTTDTDNVKPTSTGSAQDIEDLLEIIVCLIPQLAFQF